MTRTTELPEETIELILKLDKAGLSPSQIAEEVGLNYQSIVYVVYNYDW